MESSETSRRVAAGIKNFIPPNDPLVSSYFIKYDNPATNLEMIRNTQTTQPPVFQVVAGDPVMAAISNSLADTTSDANEAISGGKVRVPFISTAYNYRAAGSSSWYDPLSYEQDLCQRSNLRQTLATLRRPGDSFHWLYPISATS
ncbi:hypothetical protein E4U58_004970 [Claviceps cyperi]|nr:hypothetical protein E4U58_004970 [Claviceps cyperi]